MKKRTILAFTIVELVVVMSILGILATLGFMSYQGYSENARDVKRKTDIGNITKQLELRKIQGEDLFSFVLNEDSSIPFDIEISGYQGAIELGTTYKAGDADYIYLDLVGENFTDPKTGDIYKIGVTSHQNRYEVASSLENGGIYSSYVDGTWLPRFTGETQVDVAKIIGNVVYLSGSKKSDLLLYSSDIVTIGNLLTEKYTIDKVFNNKVQLNRPVAVTGATIELFSDESEHLIKSWSGDFPISTQLGANYTPYNLIP